MYSAKYGFTLSQRTVDKKNQEAKAIVEMLDELKKEEEDPLKDLSQEDKERLIKELLEEEMKKGE